MAGKVGGILLIVGGVVGFLVFLLTSIFGFLGAIKQIDTPGSAQLSFEPGPHTVYWEIHSTSKFRKPTGAPDGLRVSVSRDGTELKLESSGPMTTRYSSGSRAGVSILGFDVPSGGPWTVSASGVAAGQGTLAIGPAVGFFGVLKIVLGCLAFMGLGLGVGIPLVVRSAKKA